MAEFPTARVLLTIILIPSLASITIITIINNKRIDLIQDRINNLVILKRATLNNSRINIIIIMWNQFFANLNTSNKISAIIKMNTISVKLINILHAVKINNIKIIITEKSLFLLKWWKHNVLNYTTATN